jgi:hypothetical protein
VSTYDYLDEDRPAGRILHVYLSLSGRCHRGPKVVYYEGLSDELLRRHERPDGTSS